MNNKIIFIATLPEPTTGQSISNKFILDKISAECKVTVINTSPKSIKKSFSYHLNRIKSTTKAILELSKNPRQSTVYTVYESGIGIIYNYAIVSMARIFNHKIYIHHHTSQHTKSKLTRFNVLLHIAKNSTHILLSNGMRQDFEKNYKGKFNSIVVQNHSMISIKNSSAVRFENNNINIGFISNLTLEKGALRSIECLRHLISNGINASLLMAGPTVNEETNAHLLKAKKELGENLKILGSINGTEKQKFFDGIDLLIFPSSYKYEAQPLVVLEAMAAGIPVIVSNYGYISELAPDPSFVCHDLAEFNSFVLGKINSYLSNKIIYQEDAKKCLAHFIATKKISEAETSNLVSNMKNSNFN
jgi:glycosyltransferase involved in cell wall biosynthesis